MITLTFSHDEVKTLLDALASHLDWLESKDCYKSYKNADALYNKIYDEEYIGACATERTV